MAAQAPEGDLVELAIPAVPELLSLPRLTAAAVAARAGFDIEEVEDVRLAIEELCLAAFEGRGRGRLCVRLVLRDGALEVDCTFEPDRGSAELEEPRAPFAAEMTEQLLDALTDEHGTVIESGVARGWFKKSGSRAPGG